MKLQGTVIAVNPDKTAVAQIDSHRVHELYGKRYITSKKFYIHDEKNQAKVGDKVEFSSIKPMSKLKRWQLDKVL